ncbi:MAG: hypothetical protein WDW36_006023 [Sanguina aurantia]
MTLAAASGAVTSSSRATPSPDSVSDNKSISPASSNMLGDDGHTPADSRSSSGSSSSSSSAVQSQPSIGPPANAAPAAVVPLSDAEVHLLEQQLLRRLAVEEAVAQALKLVQGEQAF